MNELDPESITSKHQPSQVIHGSQGMDEQVGLRPGLLKNFHVKIHVSKQQFPNMASDCLAAKLPGNQKPCQKILAN